MTDPTGQQETYRYDAQDRLCGKTDRNGTKTKYSHNMYNSLTERRAAKTDGTELIESYGYTPEGLLESAISGGMRYSYAYDVMGRLTEKKASGRTLLSFKYDPNGNLTHQTDVTGKVTEYRYDLADNISEVWDDGMETFSGNIQINRYDAEGLRHEMEENGKLVSFIFRGDEVVAEESR